MEVEIKAKGTVITEKVVPAFTMCEEIMDKPYMYQILVFDTLATQHTYLSIHTIKPTRSCL